MHKDKTIHLLGYASGIAAADAGCAEGPIALQQSSYLHNLENLGINLNWSAIFKADDTFATKLSIVADLSQKLSKAVTTILKNKQFFITIGGDHSSAIGTWSGAQHALRDQGPIGLIWIDAHMDSHTPDTSLSGNIHGMPVASLLGYGSPSLTQILNNLPKLKPEHLCLIGVRSFESGEEALLKQLNVRVILMDEVKQRGMSAVLEEAQTIVTKGTTGYGVSIDIDSIDPSDAPGTGVREPNGILANDLCQALKIIADDEHLIGAEIVEFDPHRDIDNKTEKLIVKLISILTPGKRLE